MRGLRLAAMVLLALPPAARAYRERLILTVDEAGCTFRLEADDEGTSLRLRVVRTEPRCQPSREAVQSFLRAAFSRLDGPRGGGAYSSLSVGRLIDLPWLAAHLATTAYGDPDWDPGRGKPVRAGVERYVAALLSRPEVTTQLESVIQASGYGIRSAVVEKVLVGGLRDVPGHAGTQRAGKVPFDAMVWFMLEKRPRVRGSERP